ncbi:hypothetical protein STW0522CIT26_15840 [Citrobacter portucalensis]|nr:hypothetical protein STW0522CIT26_15840 [Citrobacter portucalensis]BBV75453.1 hypothetical protein STW0522RAO56_15070 [Raoultella planticola]BBW11077.1 hypothetical protein STN0717CIT27_15530 [Citrobacter portucalensis]
MRYVNQHGDVKLIILSIIKLTTFYTIIHQFIVFLKHKSWLN